ncbi:unnamed protein product [Lactuca virosa]|uniref:Uncharacterized protein n=1 Tax=Lactuca virosa TaxID=75947 RepID=A0AAU9M3N2_9ASTR|nr:unnamed protein product [Lactuca virosa]
MAENDNEVVYLRVHLHYNGVFVRHPSGYVGGNYFLFTDVDWAGIRPIVDDLDFAQFIDTEYEYGEISVYVDHNGSGLEEWWDDDMNLVVSEDNVSGLKDDGVPRNEGNTVPDETHPNIGLEDEVIDIDKIPLNKTSGDEFLSERSVNGGVGGVQGSVNSGAGGVHGSVNGCAGGVHGGEGGGVHGVRKKKVKARDVGVAVRTRKPSERILKTKLAKAVYGKNGEGSSTTNAVDID